MKLEQIGFYSLCDERVKNTSITSQMQRCEIIITEYCNFNCPYCRGLADKIYGQRKLKMLSLDEIKQAIDYWCEGKLLKNIRFSGGEPTLHPNIKEIVSYAKSKGVERIAISTNGSNKIELYEELIRLGVNDYSISLDACCAEDGDKMAGNKKGSWKKVIKNIERLSKLTYVTVGVVLTEENVQKTIDTIRFADKLGVSDIRIISAAQYNKPLPRLNEIETEILDKHPILKYRVNHFANGINVRGLSEQDNNQCPLMLDDSIVAGDYVFPCVIYMREGGKPVCKVGPNMRQQRLEYIKKHDTLKDPICKKNCLDVCKQYNNEYKKVHGEVQ